jgi:hypothetical protein
MSGLLQNSFDPQTGHMENVHIATTVISQSSNQSYVEHEDLEFFAENPVYCSYCGSILNVGASEYCEFCGQAVSIKLG